jgi:hypothetical protein
MSTKLVPTSEELEMIRRERYRKAAELLRQWASEDPEYDERVGALLEIELKDAGLRCEDRDEPAA